MTFKRTQVWVVVLSVVLGPAFLVEAATEVPISVKKVTGDLEMYNTINVEVDKLTEYLKQPGKDAKKFILYLDWRPLKGVNARLVDGTDQLLFDIKRTADSKDQWNALLGSPFDKGCRYDVSVSVGYDTEKPIPSEIKYPLIVIKTKWLWSSVGFFALFLVLFLMLVRKSAIIRDPSTLPPIERPYSLGRTQMAVWFFTIAVSYFLIWMVTSNLQSITNSTLVLMGISSATALGAVQIGAQSKKGEETKIQDLQKEKAALGERLNNTIEEAINKASGADKSILENEKAQKKARLAQVTMEIEALNAALAPKKTKGFLWDMIEDVEGVSFHRFQIFGWTIILWFIFMISMYRTLEMPQFNDTLLTLMGISGGTYIGFKFPEKKN
jgi:hypothetical protein